MWPGLATVASSKPFPSALLDLVDKRSDMIYNNNFTEKLGERKISMHFERRRHGTQHPAGTGNSIVPAASPAACSLRP
jgi:hypothetical protein